MHVIVVGGGVVGAAAALALAERGMRVTLIEACTALAETTSHANGGGVTPLHAEPWNSPALPAALLRYVGRGNAPWRLPAGRIASLARWGGSFLANARRPRFIENARANIRLAGYSLSVLREWRQRYQLEYAQTTAGSIQLYFSGEALAKSLALRRSLLEGAGKVEALDAGAVIEREPALAPVAGRLAGGLFYPEHESGDACAFAHQAAERAVALGATLRLGQRVRRIHCGGEQFRAVETEGEQIEADAVVIATGPETPRLLEPLGLRVPIEPVRGYSATFELDDPAALPTRPLLDTSRRFVTLRLGERGLRIAGLADFAGHHRAIAPARMDVLLESARQLLPNLADRLTPAAGRLWAGLRPVTPDGRPLLGETRIKGLYLDTGHGPMGWTMACGSGRLIADLLAGHDPALDASAYRPGRC